MSNTATEKIFPACASCSFDIQRNSAKFDGIDYHYGCLKNTKQFGRAVAICGGCFSWLTDNYVTQLNFADEPTRTKRACGICGSQELRFRPLPGKVASE